jgi:DNA polymerase III delta prime subunit
LEVKREEKRKRRKDNQCKATFVLQIAQGDCPHLLFYGPTGAGKKTLIMALLREMYGVSAEKVSFCSSLTL